MIKKNWRKPVLVVLKANKTNQGPNTTSDGLTGGS